MKANKKSASWVSLKWVKSNKCRREKERREKVSVNNGQYKRLDQQIMISIHYANNCHN